MKKVKNQLTEFIENFKKSFIINKKYLKSIVKKPISYSVKYFFIFIFFLNIIFLSFFIIKINFLNEYKLFQSLVKSVEELPNNLIITIRNNFLSTNQNMPVFLWSDFNKNKRLLMVLDETAQEENIKDYNSFVLFTSKNVVFSSDLKFKKFSIIPYKIDYLKITKKNIIDFVTSFRRVLPLIITLFLLIIIIFVPIGIFIGYIIYIALTSLFVHLIFKLFSSKHKYTKTFQLSLHSSTLPIIINYLILNTIVITTHTYLNKIFFILLFIFAWISVYSVYPFKKRK